MIEMTGTFDYDLGVITEHVQELVQRCTAMYSLVLRCTFCTGAQLSSLDYDQLLCRGHYT
jgi:hypothetical protein